jgi:hypothetical protein
MKLTIIIVVALILAVSHYSLYELGKSKAEIEYRTEVDTVEVEVKIPDSTGFKPKLIVVKEKVNVDSLFEVAKKYWEHLKPDTLYQPYAFIASLDSVYEDNLLRADINLVSRIPIDPEAYYKLNFDVKKEVVFVPTYKKSEPSWFYRRFGFFLGAGYGYNFDNKQVSPQVGIYFGINLF